jgi:hypothetical protein
MRQLLKPTAGTVPVYFRPLAAPVRRTLQGDEGVSLGSLLFRGEGGNDAQV